MNYGENTYGKRRHLPTIMATVGILLIMAGVAMWAYNLGSMAYTIHPGLGSLDYAKATCDKAHREISGASEQACGEALDASNSEYLCNEGGSSCWIESK